MYKYFHHMLGFWNIGKYVAILSRQIVIISIASPHSYSLHERAMNRCLPESENIDQLLDISILFVRFPLLLLLLLLILSVSFFLAPFFSIKFPFGWWGMSRVKNSFPMLQILLRVMHDLCYLKTFIFKAILFTIFLLSSSYFRVFTFYLLFWSALIGFCSSTGNNYLLIYLIKDWLFQIISWLFTSYDTYQVDA